MSNPLRVLDAARSVVDAVHAQVIESPRRFLHEDQLLASAESIVANIREGYGRREGPERNSFFRYARASAEETDEHLRTNHRQGILEAPKFWPLHNRLAVIVRMLTALMA
jgi:four helix bundle protein